MFNKDPLSEQLRQPIITTSEQHHPEIDPQIHVIPTLINGVTLDKERILQKGNLWAGISFAGEVISDGRIKTSVALNYDGNAPFSQSVKNAVGQVHQIPSRIADHTARKQSLEIDIAYMMTLDSLYTADKTDNDHKLFCKLSDKTTASHLLQYGLNKDPQGFAPFDTNLLQDQKIRDYLTASLENRFMLVATKTDRYYGKTAHQEPISGAKIVQDVMTTRKRQDYGGSSSLIAIAEGQNTNKKGGLESTHATFLLTSLDKNLGWRLQKDFILSHFYHEAVKSHKLNHGVQATPKELGFPEFDPTTPNGPERLKIAKMINRDMPSLVDNLRDELIDPLMNTHFNGDTTKLRQIADLALYEQYNAYYQKIYDPKKQLFWSDLDTNQQQEFIQKLNQQDKPYLVANIQDPLSANFTKKADGTYHLDVEVTPAGSKVSRFTTPIAQNEYFTNATLVLQSRQEGETISNPLQNAGVSLSHNAVESIQHYSLGVTKAGVNPNDTTNNPETTNTDFAPQLVALIKQYHQEQATRQDIYTKRYSKEIEAGERVDTIPSNRHITLQFSTLSSLFKKDNNNPNGDTFLTFPSQKDAPLPSVTIDDFTLPHLKALATLTDPVYVETCNRYDDLVAWEKEHKKERLKFLKDFVLKNELTALTDPLNADKKWQAPLSTEQDDVIDSIKETFNYRVQQIQKSKGNPHLSPTELDNILMEVDFGGTPYETEPEKIFAQSPDELDNLSDTQREQLHFLRNLPPPLTEIASQKAMYGLQIHRFETLASILNLPSVHQEMVANELLNPQDTAGAKAYHGVNKDNLMWQNFGNPFGDYSKSMQNEGFVQHPLANHSITQITNLAGQEMNARKLLDCYLKGFAVNNQTFSVKADDPVHQDYFNTPHPLPPTRAEQHRQFFLAQNKRGNNYSDEFVQAYIDTLENSAKQVSLGITLFTGERIVHDFSPTSKNTQKKHENAPYYKVLPLNALDENPMVSVFNDLVKGVGSFDTKHLGRRFNINNVSTTHQISDHMIRRQEASDEDKSFRYTIRDNSRIDRYGMEALFVPTPKARHGIVTITQDKSLASPTITTFQSVMLPSSQHKKARDVRFDGSDMDIKKPLNAFAVLSRDYGRHRFTLNHSNVLTIAQMSARLQNSPDVPNDKIEPISPPKFGIPTTGSQRVHGSLLDSHLYQQQNIVADIVAQQQPSKPKAPEVDKTPADIVSMYKNRKKPTTPPMP